MNSMTNKGVADISAQEILSFTEGTIVKQVLDTMRDELDDHRQTINENTTEIETVFEFLSALEAKFDNVQQLVERLALSLQEPQQLIGALNRREKAVCQSLFLLGKTKPWVSCEELAKHCQISREVLAATLAGLVTKHVPVMKKYDHTRAYAQLAPSFREQQAKHNVIKADCQLIQWIQEPQIHQSFQP